LFVPGALVCALSFCRAGVAAAEYSPAHEERAYALEAYIRMVDQIVEDAIRPVRRVRTQDHYVPLEIPGAPAREYLLKEVSVRPSRAADVFVRSLKRDLLAAGFIPISRTTADHPHEKCREITVYHDAFPIYILRLREKIAARVAFIIDDVGYNERALPYALALNCPVTFAVLPGLAYSRKTAAVLRENNFQIMLHLPLESGLKPSLQEKGTIRAGMSSSEIIGLLTRDLAFFPGVVGVNNHMGSKATKDKALMKTILQELKKRNLFFVDSVTTVGVSAVPAVCAELGIAYKGRDVFLDNRRTRSYIRGQIEQLKKIALSRGAAVGIGHFYPITLTVIEEMRPEFEDADINIVSMSELFERDENSAAKTAASDE
jgi:polysaccharide deacetylase 2 family uncharacterized protein YibQ